MIKFIYGENMRIINKVNTLFNIISSKITMIQFLNGNILKIIAMLIMFIDHFTKSFVIYNYNNIINILGMSYYELYDLLKKIIWPIGSIAFPIYYFLIVEGFIHTKHLKKYFLLLFLFAIISEIPFDLVFFKNEMQSMNSTPIYLEYQNVFFTLLLGLTTIWGISKINKYFSNRVINRIFCYAFSGLLITATSIFAEKLMCDYGAYGVLLITILYLTRTNRIYQVISYVLLFFLFKHYLNFPQLIIPILMLLYNGKRGKLKLKYFGYIFYPAHLTLLYILSLIKV